MKKVGRIILQVVIIVVLAALLIGGALYYSYVKTDETQVPQPVFSLGETALHPDALEWHTPVFGGIVYKDYSEQAPENAAQFTLDVASLAVTAPAELQLTVRDADGAVVSAQQDGSYVFTKNGDYTYEASYMVPKQSGQGYGMQHYSGSFTVAVEPKVLFSGDQIAQGGVLSIVVSGIMDGSLPTVETTLGYAQFATRGDVYVADVGAAYNTAAGEYDVTVTCGELTERRTVQVIPGEFETQNMTIDEGTVDSTMNNPNAAPEWREVIWPLYEQGDDTIYWEDVFSAPLAGELKLNTTFGLYRYTNGSSTAERHAGVDLDADEGDAVYAANNGRVAYAGTLIYTGNTVVIEHGAGLKTYYFHMSALNCQKGDMVTAGQEIGKAGSTGYSTGAHLHFEARIGRQSIDPMALLDGTSGIYFAG